MNKLSILPNQCCRGPRLVCFLIACSILSLSPLNWADEVKWKEYNSSHFIIYFQEATTDLVEKTAQAAEDHFARIGTKLGYQSYPQWFGKSRVKIYIYNDEDQHNVVNPVFHRVGGLAHSDTKQITTYVNQEDYFLNEMLPHELGHILLHRFLYYDNQSNQTASSIVPVWFDEGMATLQEVDTFNRAEERVKTYLEINEYIDINSLNWHGDDENLHFSYASAASITRFLLSKMQGSKLRSFLTAIKNSKNFESALRSTSNGNIPSIESLNKKWIQFIKQ